MADKEAKAAGKEEKPKEPEMVSLKDVAKAAGVGPREARAILRKIGARSDDQKRSHWQFDPKEVSGVVAKIKGALAEKTKKAEEARKAKE